MEKLRPEGFWKFRDQTRFKKPIPEDDWFQLRLFERMVKIYVHTSITSISNLTWSNGKSGVWNWKIGRLVDGDVDGTVAVIDF